MEASQLDNARSGDEAIQLNWYFQHLPNHRTRNCHDTSSILCQECTALGREIRYVMKSMTYKQFKTENNYCKPDMVLVQNCGFHEYEIETEEWHSGWQAGIASLSALKDIPVIFTSYTKGEARADLQRFLDASDSGVDILVNCEENPMRSYRPIRDWEMDDEKDVFYSNQYINVIMGSG